MVKVITGVIRKDNSFVSFSVKNFVAWAKKSVKRFFAWCHRGLTWLENKALEKIDKIGKRMAKRLAKRNEPTEVIVE